jgi:hypothetical protein
MDVDHEKFTYTFASGDMHIGFCLDLLAFNRQEYNKHLYDCRNSSAVSGQFTT